MACWGWLLHDSRYQSVSLTTGSRSISKNITLCSVRSVHLTHLTLERKSGTRTQPPYHTMHLTQPDRTPNPQDTPDAAPSTQDAPDAAPSTQDAPGAAPNTQDAI